MERIKILETNLFNTDDLQQYKDDCFYEIKRNAFFYGILQNNGFGDDSIKANIGTLHTYFLDYFEWQKIKTYDDVVRSGIKYDYTLKYDGKSIIRERGILAPFKEHLDYISKFIVKDFDDSFNGVRLKDIDNKGVKKDILSLCKNNSWIYLTGAIRSGRTYCAIAMTNSSARKGNDHLAFIDCPKEIKRLSSLFFNNQNEFNSKLSALKNAYLLVLDNFGSEYINDIVRDSIIIPLLDCRARNNLMTIFTSDFSLDDLIILYSKKDRDGNNIRGKQLSNILQAKISKEIVTSKNSLY